MSYYRDQLEQWLKTIDVKADRVLDWGGGALPVKDRVKSWDVKEYFIADIETEPQKEKADMHEDINLTQLFQEKFDVVFCLEVFEYVYNPITAVHNLYSALNLGGKLYITFPFVYPVHEPIDYDFLRYTLSGACRLLQEGGFELEKIKVTSRKDKSGLLTAFYAQDGMHPSKAVNYHNATGWLIEVTK